MEQAQSELTPFRGAMATRAVPPLLSAGFDTNGLPAVITLSNPQNLGANEPGTPLG